MIPIASTACGSRSVGALYGDPELAAEALIAAEGQTRVRLNRLWFELQRPAERTRDHG